MSKFTILEDPGHAWLEVSKAELERVGLNRADFSVFSYRDMRNVYLEEDCDMEIYVNRLIDRGEIENYKEFSLNINNVHTDGDSFVRDLPSIAA